MSTDPIDALADTVRRIRELSTDLAQLTAERDTAIIAAYYAGHGLTELSRVDGRSRQMLHRIVRAAE